MNVVLFISLVLILELVSYPLGVIWKIVSDIRKGLWLVIFVVLAHIILINSGVDVPYVNVVASGNTGNVVEVATSSAMRIGTDNGINFDDSKNYYVSSSSDEDSLDNFISSSDENKTCHCSFYNNSNKVYSCDLGKFKSLSGKDVLEYYNKWQSSGVVPTTDTTYKILFLRYTRGN